MRLSIFLADFTAASAFPILILVSRTWNNMQYAQCRTKIRKDAEHKLRAWIRHNTFRYTVSSKMALQTMDHSTCGRSVENVNLKKIGKIVNNDQIIFLVEFKQIDTTFFPGRSTFSMLLQRLLELHGLFCWHTSQLSASCLMSLFIPIQNIVSRARQSILS